MKKSWIDSLKWYVLLYDFNQKKVYRYNIFNNSKVCDFLEKYFKKFITFDDFKRELDATFMYAFWSKAEYEILVNDLLDIEENKAKVDVYYQLELNLDIIAHYIVEMYNNRSYARKKI